MARPFLSVIIPAFNEQERLPLTLVDVDRHLSEYDYPYEIIVVVSLSSDKTVEMVKRFASFVPHLKYIALPENRGKGFAVKTGMLAAKGTWHLYMDADNSTAVVEFNKMLPYLTGIGEKSEKKDAYDIAIGSRYMPNSHISPKKPASRRGAGVFARMMIKLLGVRGFYDTQCGFKCFSADASKRIFNEVETAGWLFDVEALALAKKMGYRVKEVPVFWAHNPGSKVGARQYLKSFGELIRIWLRMRTYRVS